MLAASLFVHNLHSYNRIGFWRALHANRAAGPGRPHCHMHDFTDANMHALAAVETVYGPQPMATPESFNATCAAINLLWDEAHAAGMLSEREPALWALVRAVAYHTDYGWDEDDDAMRGQDAAALAAWADDIACRLGLEPLASALYDYARERAETQAEAVLRAAFPLLPLDYADPRGDNYGGTCLRGREDQLGLYLASGGYRWVVSAGELPEVDVSRETQTFHELDTDAAVRALQRIANTTEGSERA